MDFAIEFNDQPPVGTAKVDHKSADRMLAAEFQSAKPTIAKRIPQNPLSDRLPIPEVAQRARCNGAEGDRWPSP
jgi:hypothetical protein